MQTSIDYIEIKMPNVKKVGSQQQKNMLQELVATNLSEMRKNVKEFFLL